jgi:hypothetical protein
MAKKRKKTKYDGQKEKEDKIRWPKRERRQNTMAKKRKKTKGEVW